MAQITYKHIYDLITDAKKQGLIPIELSFDENIQLTNYIYHLGTYTPFVLREPILTIRFREQ